MDSMRTKALSELLDMLTSMPVKKGEKPMEAEISVEMSSEADESYSPFDKEKNKLLGKAKGEKEKEV